MDGGFPAVLVTKAGFILWLLRVSAPTLQTLETRVLQGVVDQLRALPPLQNVGAIYELVI